MKLIASVIVTVWSICLLAVTVAGAGNFMTPLPDTSLDIPRQYYPGGSDLSGAMCNTNYEAESLIETCTVGDIFYEYDPVQGAITSVYRELWRKHVMIGDLLLTYGAPVHATYADRGGILIFANGTRVSYWLRPGQSFGPRTTAFYLYRATANESLSPWRGFTTENLNARSSTKVLLR